MLKPITFLQMAKMAWRATRRHGKAASKPTSQSKVRLLTSKRNGEQDAKRLLEVREEAIRPSVIKLRSLLAKGQIFGSLATRNVGMES